jgi:O-6-methylguanine DNA methyltransferase
MTLPRRTPEKAVSACLVQARFDEPHGILRRLAKDIRRYFDGEVVDLSEYPVDVTSHPPFRQSALLAARRIPYGEIRTYAWLAKTAGNPKAQRAAGQAMRRNPLPLVIPCHRVVRSDGTIGGFGGGRRMKRSLLELEGIRVGCGDTTGSRRAWDVGLREGHLTSSAKARGR